MKDILYYRLMKENAKVELPCGSPLHFRLENNFHDTYLAVTNKWEECGLECYEGYLCDKWFVQLDKEVFVYETEFQSNKEYTKEDINKTQLFWLTPECCMDNSIPNRILNINGKVFHFVPFEKWGKNWDITYGLTVESALKDIDEPVELNFNPRYYGIGGFRGLVSLEMVTDNCGVIDSHEQLEAAKLGCDIIYEYLP